MGDTAHVLATDLKGKVKQFFTTHPPTLIYFNSRLLTKSSHVYSENNIFLFLSVMCILLIILSTKYSAWISNLLLGPLLLR